MAAAGGESGEWLRWHTPQQCFAAWQSVWSALTAIVCDQVRPQKISSTSTMAGMRERPSMDRFDYLTDLIEPGLGRHGPFVTVEH